MIRLLRSSGCRELFRPHRSTGLILLCAGHFRLNPDSRHVDEHWISWHATCWHARNEICPHGIGYAVSQITILAPKVMVVLWFCRPMLLDTHDQTTRIYCGPLRRCGVAGGGVRAASDDAGDRVSRYCFA